MIRVPAIDLPIETLQRRIAGRLITPDLADYHAACSVVAGGIDRRPALIVQVVDDDDVARVVRLARETGLELAVRSGGHSARGHGVTEGGIVLDFASTSRSDRSARTEPPDQPTVTVASRTPVRGCQVTRSDPALRAVASTPAGGTGFRPSSWPSVASTSPAES
jgi:hypothetical protein